MQISPLRLVGATLALVGLVGVPAPPAARGLVHGETSATRTGSASGGVAIDATSGAATLEIPIDLPPGPGGLGPDLALRYSSQRGNGLLGVGWAVEWPRVSCSTRFGVPDYSACAHHELGGELLVGPDTQASPPVWHTFEESFTKVTRSAAFGSWTWRATSTEGVVRTFGADEDSRVMGRGGVSEWALSTIEDPWGNRVVYEYTRGPAGDAGSLRPGRIHWADETREVRFVYEARPDATVDYAGGVRRARSERLREIRVFASGALHHRLILRYETSRSSTQSRLVSIQRFGADCDPQAHPDPTAGADCAALPALELEYTDPADISPAARWEGHPAPGDAAGPLPWYAPSGARFSTGEQFLRGLTTRLADVDGDGLPDVVYDKPGRHDADAYLDGVGGGHNVPPAPDAGPYVALGNGIDGWDEPTWDGGTSFPASPASVPDNDSARWTDRIRALRFDLPSMRVDQVLSFDTFDFAGDAYAAASNDDGTFAMGTCVAAGAPLPSIAWLQDAGSVQYGARTLGGSPPYFDATAFRNRDLDDPNSTGVPLDVPSPTELRPWPHFELVDLDADGRADMVMSVHLSGFHLSLDDCESATLRPEGQGVWIPGATTRVVFRNTGDGFVRDDGRDPSDGNWADTLPPFGLVAFESADYAFREIGRTQPNGGYHDRHPMNSSPCDDYGLAGQRGRFAAGAEYRFTTSWDFCTTTYDLAPAFHDLNADGYPDLVVTRTTNPDALFHRYTSTWGSGAPIGFRESTTESVVYLQDPEAQGDAPRWVRAPAYDPPYEHAYVLQVNGDSPGPTMVQASSDAAGNAQTYHLDKGVRFVDLNRDGLVDLLFSANGVGDFGGQGGVLLNRGALPGDPRHGAWCSSAPLPGVDPCIADASPYLAPQVFAGDVQTWLVDWASVMVTSFMRAAQFVDLNGDGWVDLLVSHPDGAPYTGAYLHHPGRAGSVWVEDPRFRPPVTALLRDTAHILGGAQTGHDWAQPTGYGIADVNADGVADLIASDPYLMSHLGSWTSTPASAHADLLRVFRNGLGLEVELAYAAPRARRDAALEARALEHALAPLSDPDMDDALAEPLGPDPAWPSVDDEIAWPRLPVLVSKRVSAPGRFPSETTYRYAQPRRCATHGMTLGFRLVEETRGDGSRVESFYFQKHGRAGRLARRVRYDETDRPRHVIDESWSTPHPASVTGGWADASFGAFGVAHLGRLVERRERTEYGTTIGASPGFTTTTRWIHDDVHGYGFVAEEHHDVPGRGLRIVTTPTAPDVAHHLVERTARVAVFADQGADQRRLADTRFEYQDREGRDTFGRVGIRRRLVVDRDTPGPDSWQRTDYRYSASGNLVEERALGEDSGSAEMRVTLHCWDGEPGCATGQGSRSLRVGTRDAAGQWTRIEPHPVFARALRVDSDYRDVPDERLEYDPLGRLVTRRHAGVAAGQARLLFEREYTDFPDSGWPHAGGFVPFRVTRHHADDDPAHAIETIEVEDGLGGAAIRIELLEALASDPVTLVAHARQWARTPDARSARVSEPFACDTPDGLGATDHVRVVAACAATPEHARSFVERHWDALGRTVRVDTPLGFEVYAYSAESIPVPGSGTAVPHDRVLWKTAHGALQETLLAGDLPVRVRECRSEALAPELEGLEGVGCASPDETRLLYEPTGELWERQDPTVAASAGSGGPMANQRMRFFRDTLGRVTRLEDPDAGVTEQVWDAFGALAAATDARGVTRHREHDVLGRLTRIAVEGETPTEIRYHAFWRRPARIIDGPVERWYVYDRFGRTWRDGLQIDGVTLMRDRTYDRLGRTTRIAYPTVLEGAVDTVAYDYRGRRLLRVCDVGVDGGDCDSPEASPIVAGVAYDAIGRVSGMSLPGGERRFRYDGASRRRVEADFLSASPNEDVHFHYRLEGGAPAYDAGGRLLRIDATLGSGTNGEAYESRFAYDARRRLSRWTWNGETHDFAYDARGNLVLHAGTVQDFASEQTAHALRTRTSPSGTTWTYDYDAAGQLRSRWSALSGTTHFRFDGRGRLDCVGSAAGGCDRLAVVYDGRDERVKEVGSRTYLYAGTDFRFGADVPGPPEYWIEISALGERVAYKHVVGGALRLVGAGPGARPRPSAPNAGPGLPIVALLLLLGLASAFSLRAPLRRRAAIAATLSIGVVVGPVPSGAWSLFAWAPVNPYGPGTSEIRWVLTDPIGSGLVELDRDGRRVDHRVYAPFGRLVHQSGAAGSAGRRVFAGHDRQLDVGLVYMHARWLDPATGTFTSVDPVVRRGDDPQAWNGYAYAQNDPVNAIDPTGEKTWHFASVDPATGQKYTWQQSTGGGGSSASGLSGGRGVDVGSVGASDGAAAGAGIGTSGGAVQVASAGAAARAIKHAIDCARNAACRSNVKKTGKEAAKRAREAIRKVRERYDRKPRTKAEKPKKDELSVELGKDGSIKRPDPLRDTIEEVRTPEQFPEAPQPGKTADFLSELKQFLEDWVF